MNYCRKNIFPTLTDDAIEVLANLWAILREKDLNNKDTLKVLPITIRSYETLIRLSTAHAKLRLSPTVDVNDCKEAFKLMVFSLFQDEEALKNELEECLKGVGAEMEVEPEIQPPKSKSKTRTTQKTQAETKPAQPPQSPRPSESAASMSQKE